VSRTKDFDVAINRVTQDRGKDYGHPLDDFARINLMKYALRSCPHDEVRHALEMIAVKMSRLCSTPSHSDSVHDIAGYARTICILLDEEEKRNGET
jgi:hypothetical protein